MSSSSCAVCQDPNGKLCSACHKIHYCSTAHQKSHRKTHKPDCFPATLKSDPVQGRYFAATKGLKPGDRIFSEKALVVGPTGAEKYFHRICLGCYKVVRTEYKCSGCGWPVCSEACEKLPPHHSEECSILSTVPPYFSKPFEYDFIKFLRTLLLRRSHPPDTSKWSQIQQLASHKHLRSQCSQAVRATEASYDFITRICGLQEFDFDTVDHVVGVWGVNSFGANAPSGPEPTGRLASFLFPKTSLCSHSCIANTRGLLTQEDGRSPIFSMDLVASTPISTDSPILITYAEVGEGTFERQKVLRDHYYFSCSCPRCQDPTELQTYFSAFKCPECPPGYLLPKDPLEVNPDWVCSCAASGDFNNNSSCSPHQVKFFKYAQLSTPLLKIKQQLNSIGTKDTSTEIGKLESILKEHSGKTLHPNHWLLTEVRFRLIQRYICYMPEAKNVKNVLDKCIDHGYQVLGVANVIRPGYNVYRGKILYCLCQARLQQVVRDEAQDVLTKRATLASILKQAEEAQEILAKEPSGSDERTIAEALVEDVSQIHRIIAVFDGKLKMGRS